jgi:Calcineurin-like phosphoesterase
MAGMTDGEPGRVVIAADWHGNTDQAVHVIGMTGRILEGEPRPLILQLGDFGVWPGPAGAAYLESVRGACRESGVLVRFIDGNHEDFTQLEGLRMREGRRFGGDAPLAWIPRGHRWTWHGRAWMALGGAVSLDRAIRTEGASWWPDEEITAGQAASAIGGGPADVMVTHDCPGMVVHTFPPPPRFWDLADLARSDAHRERLQRIVSAVRPRWLMHGHLHRAYRRACDLGYGPVQVTGLDCAEGDGPNWAVLDVKRMVWAKT